jgi:hypothetical protein
MSRFFLLKNISDVKILVFISGIAISIRVSLLILSYYFPVVHSMISERDAIGYLQLARNIWEFQEFRFATGGPTAFRMPGYPIYLALTSVSVNSHLPAQVIQIFSDIISIFIVYILSRRLFGDRSIPLLGAFFLAIHPTLALSSISIYPETLSSIILVFTILILIEFRDRWVAGLIASILLAAAIYLKTSNASVAFALITIYSMNYLVSNSIKKNSVFLALLPYIMIVLLLLPWIIRNFLTIESFVPLTTSYGINLWGGNNPLADGGYVSNERYVVRGMNEVESNYFYKRRAYEWISENPGQFIYLIPKKAFRFFSPFYLGTSGIVPLPTILYNPGYIFVLIFYFGSLLGFYQLYRQKDFYVLIIMLVPLLMLFGTSLVTFGGARFLSPVIPIFCILAASGFVTFLDRGMFRARAVSHKIKNVITFPSSSEI